MKTIILCGGRGTRLGDSTIPKALMRVGEKPIIWHIMQHYAKFGYNEFVLALGYMGDQIKQHFLLNEMYSSDFTIHSNGAVERHVSLDGNDHPFIAVTFVDTGLDTLSGERIKRCAKYLDGDRFAVTYCDGVSDIDIGKLIEHHKTASLLGRLGTITVVKPHSKFGMINIGKTGVVDSFQEKPTLDSYVNGGFMVFERSVLDYINNNEMEHEMLKRLIAEKKLSGYVHDDFWMAVDTMKELEELNKFYQEGKWK